MSLIHYICHILPLVSKRVAGWGHICVEKRIPGAEIPLGNHFTERQFYVMMDMVFEWDPEEERKNVKKHGVHFKTAERIFFDYHRMWRHDEDSSDDEDRWQTMGFFEKVFFVVYTERGDNGIRIISARVAEPFERRIYHGDGETHGWQRVNP